VLHGRAGAYIAGTWASANSEATSSPRPATPILPKTVLGWSRTVYADRHSSAAISGLERARATPG
jgi:hypothetical protein